MNNNSQQLKILLDKRKQEKDFAIYQERKSSALMILRNIDKVSIWLQKEKIKLLVFYKDIEEVQDRLTALAKANEELKEYIADFFNDNIDVSVLQKERDKFKQVLFDASISSKDVSEGNTELINPALNLVLMKNK